MATFYIFRIISFEEDSFVLEIEAGSGMSFYQLHQCIQKLLKYDAGHPASFYLTNHKWEKEKEITLIDQDVSDHKNMLNMEKEILKDHLNVRKKRMLYVYDFFFERAFNIELVKISEKKGVKIKDLPRGIRQEGKIPAQILMPEFIPGEDNPDDFPDSDMDEGFGLLDDLDI